MSKKVRSKVDHLLIAIDPGDNTGIAVFSEKNPIPFETQLIKESSKTKKLSKDERLKLQSEKFYWYINDLLDTFDVKNNEIYFVIEGVKHYGGDVKSTAASTRGDLFKLAYLVGSYFYIGTCFTEHVRIVLPTEWKGQMTKDGVKSRVKRRIDQTFSTDHVTDAVGIGLKELGVF